MKPIKSYSNEAATKTAKVYEDLEWGEYRVEFYQGGKHLKGASYHADTKSDAVY